MSAIEPAFMRLALDKAREGMERGQTPFGACIVRGGQVLGCAHNTVWADTDSTAHAEINAVREACRKTGSIDLSGAVIYSTCEPCPMCFSACHWAKIDTIFFGARIADAAQAGFAELHLSTERMKELGGSPIRIVSGVLEEEARDLFRLWSARQDRRTY